MACIVEGKRRPWPQRNIAFEINTGDFSVGTNNHNAILAAIAHINTNTVINLQARTNEIDYVFFKKGENCSSKVGYGRPLLNQNPAVLYRHDINCENPTMGRIIHEICHALGIWHEQSRQDRDDYISIRFGRIGDGKQHNFYRHLEDGIDFGIYDYDSIMHYSRSTGFETSWVINKQIAGQTSKAASSLAAYSGNLHMVHLGDSSNDIWHSWFDGSNWTLNVRVPNQQSKESPSLAAYNGNLHMVHLGDSSNDIWHSWFDGNNWTPNVRIPNQQSKASPSLAEYNGNLHMVHIGDSSNDIWHSWFDGNNWTPNVRIPNQQSKASPSLAAYNGNLHMVHLGDSSNDIWHSWFDGNNWTPNVRIPDQQSKASPSLAPYNGNLHMVHIGDSSNNIWHSWFDGNSWTDNVRIYQESKNSPAIAFYNNELFINHSGNSSNDIWYSWFDNTPFESIWAPSTVNIGQRTGLSIKDIEALNFLYR